MISAGRLDQYVRLIAPDYLTDDAGQTAVTTLDLDACPEVPAMVKQESAGETLQNGSIRAVTKYTVTIRFYAGLTPAWMLNHRGRTLKIVGIVELGRCDEHQITAVETR